VEREPERQGRLNKEIMYGQIEKPPSQKSALLNQVPKNLEEPTISDCIRELNGYLSQMRSLASQIDDKLFGPRPEIEENNKYLPETIHDGSRFACQTAAAMAGYLQSILSRI
jgi:hypothetical protein